MFLVAWGVFATAFGWIVATDFRGAARRFHAMSRAATPFGGAGASCVGVGFLRAVAGVFGLIGPFVLGAGLLDLWRGEAGPGGLPPVPSLPAWLLVCEALVAGVGLWMTWRRSGMLRREWDAGTALRRAAVVVLTASVAAFLVTLSLGQGGWAVVSWLVGGLCSLTLLLGRRTDQPSAAGPAPADS
ncbi:hypothetical protein ACFYY3_12595 [Streptomyces sp. NPDC001812]|uniref:hypothetical protein n=1 Tax=Streptomyces sp. NPDC001812 TaxID=3364611 RepID=UPI0036A2DBA9